MRIENHIKSKIPATLQAELKSRVDREFGNAPIVREHVWAEPTWVFLGLVDEQLVSFLNIVDRLVLADNEPVHFFGLNNVITEPQHRGQGTRVSSIRQPPSLWATATKMPTAFSFVLML